MQGWGAPTALKCPLTPLTPPHLPFAEHIQRIMTLEESVQHVVMTAIQEVGVI